MILDDVAIELHAAYALKKIEAMTIRYDGETVIVIGKDSALAVRLMQRALDELQTPKGETIQ